MRNGRLRIFILLSFLFFSTYNTYTLLYSYIGDYMRKRFKTRKRINTRLIIYSILFLFLIFLLSIYIKRIKFLSANESFINNIFSDINNKRVEKVINYIDKNIFNSPIYLLESQLNYKKSSNNTTYFAYVEVDKPVVYIYNSHQGENYSMKYLEEYNITPNVLMASRMLSEKLNNLNINTIVEENNILEYMDKNGLDHAGSYIASRYFLENTIKKYNSIKLYIDLHRDAISHDASYININGKDCAKILFVIGLEYDTYQNNLKVVEEINNIINTKYPNLSRGIMKKQGYGVNGVYNQDLDSNVILIEIGGHENNIDEVNNTLDLVADAIKEYLNEKG